MAHPVKWFSSDMQGAPLVTDLYNTDQGSFVAMLKAVLVDGFGQLSVDTLTWDGTQGLCVAEISAGHSYMEDSIILVEGANDTNYNGEHRIVKVTQTRVWYKPDSNPSGDDTGGTPTIKVAPAGWNLLHESGDGKTCIFETGTDRGEVKLRVQNDAGEAGTKYALIGSSSTEGVFARMSMVSAVMDIDSYQLEYEHVWPACSQQNFPNASSYKHLFPDWQIYADDSAMYLIFPYGYYAEPCVFFAGYINPVKANDRYHFLLEHFDPYDSSESGWDVMYTNSEYDFDYSSMRYHQNYNRNDPSNQYRVRHFARDYTQTPGTASSTHAFYRGMYNVPGNNMPYPNPVDGGLYYGEQPVPVFEYRGSNAELEQPLRGFMPGQVEQYFWQDHKRGQTMRHLTPRAGEDVRLVRFSNVFAYSTSDTTSGTPLTAVPSRKSYTKPMGFDIGDKGWR